MEPRGHLPSLLGMTARGNGARRFRWVLFAVALAAILPSVGTLGAPLVSDDAAALGYVHRGGLFDDWLGPQYGMRIIRFWRPMVTTSLALQERLTGVEPLPLRALNLLCHVATACLAASIARRLGAGALGGLAAGLLAASFPEQGGTVTWVVGRVDSLAAPFFLLACWLALGAAEGGRRLVHAVGAGLAALLACATKEIAFVVPAWGAALAFGRGDRPLAALRAAAPLLVGAVVAFLWRRLALGVWVGGYPPPEELGVGAVGRAATTFVAVHGWILAGAVAAAALAAAGGCLRGRALAGGLVAALATAPPLFALLIDGHVEEQNLRAFQLADAGFAIAIGAALGPAANRRGLLPLLALLPLVGWRGILAATDTREWAAAGEVAAGAIASVRDKVDSAPPNEHPVLADVFPSHHGGAYCLAWGVADRYRPPFPEAHRPVWPLRPLFGSAASARPVLLERVRGLVWPLSSSALTVPELPVSVNGAMSFALRIDESVASAGGGDQVLELWGDFSGARFEFVVYTEMGYEPAAWLTAGAGEPGTTPIGGTETVRRIALGDVLRCSGFVLLGEALLQVADLGATRAYLEVRVVAGDEPVAASRFLPLEWDADLMERLAALGG